ncbi:MAG: helix-turn-helix domain-containing protein [Dehalococcoidales bacterium]
METQEFGARLRELRIQAHLTQRELADKVNIDFSYLSKIENGILPPPSEKVILRLSGVLNADKDELITLAGRIPSDIAQMLKNRETLQLLRSDLIHKKVRNSSKRSVAMPKLSIPLRSFARVAIAIILVIAIGTSLWFSSPIPVRAFGISASVSDSPISGNTTYLLGESVTIPADIQFNALESKDFQSISLNITGPESFTQTLPLTPGTYTYANLPGFLEVDVTWQPGVGAYGYGYGYGYSTGSGNISYTIQWTPPYTLTTPPTPPPSELPGADLSFDIDMSVPDQVQWDTGASLDQPQGLAYDGTYLYVLVPANYWNGTDYKDIIIKIDTQGNYNSYFAAPGNSWNTQGLTFIGSTLYAAYNEWDPNTWMDKGKVAKYVSGNWTAITGLSNLNPIGGLASDGTNLFIAHRDELRIDKRDKSTGALITSFDVASTWPTDPMMPGPPIWGFDALAYDSSGLYAAQMDCIVKVDGSTGDYINDWMTGLWDIRGLTLVSETFSGTAYNILYIGTTQWPGKVYRASKSGAVPEVENTPIGNYTTEFKVIADGTTYTETDSFTLSKLTTAPEVTISAPTQNFAVAAGSENITVSGSINDPSIATVTVGVALPAVTAFQDDVENEATTNAKWEHLNISGMMMWGPPYSQEDLWHRSSERDHTTGSGWSWRYAKESTGNYDTGMYANAGILKTKNPISVGADNILTFWTWYDSELDFWPDRKLVEASTDGSNWQPVAWVAKFWPPFVPPDITQEQFDALTMVPERTWTKVEVSLADFAGQDIYLRFRFDTMDDIMNNFEGWYVDDISITGAGFQGQSVSVDENLQFSTIFTLAEGSNTISVTAARTNYDPKLTGSASVTGSLDTTAPVISLSPVTTPTNQLYQTISGNVTEANFDRLELKKNGVLEWSTTTLTDNISFSQSIMLSEGVNTIFIEAKDKVNLTDNVTAYITLDSTGPVFNAVFPSTSGNTTYDVAYKTGEISARPGDSFFIALNVTDAASDVASVKLVTPGQSQADWPSALSKDDIPEAVIDNWGFTSATKTAMNYIIPMQLPSGTPAGDYSWTVKAWDTAGNLSQLTVTTKVVTTLEAFNIYLMPDWNLVSSPLIPTTDNITTLTANITATTLFERVWYYDASAAGTADEWKLYQPGVGGDLTTIEAGKGYWFKMKDLAAFTAAGKVSGPMATGLPNTPAPIKLTIAGQVLQAGAVVPPTYSVYAGWNLVGLHSENPLPVSTALSSVTVPQQKWGSLLQYLNYISFPMGGQGRPEIDLGRFDRLISTDTMQPGRGFWLYMVEAGTIVP